MSRISLAAVLASAPLLLCLSCTKAPSETPLGGEEARRRAATRVSLAQRFVTRSGLEERFEELLESPRVADAGRRLWSRLEQDPELAAAGSAYLERTLAEPPFRRAFSKLASEHPDWTEQQFAGLLQQRFAALTTSPAYDALFEKAFQQQAIEQSIQAWATQLAETERLIEAIVAFFLARDWQPVWRQRVGHTSGDTELLERLNTYLAGDAGTRLAEQIGMAIVEDPALEQLLVDLLEHPQLTRVLKGRALALLGAREFALAADECLLGVFEGRSMQQQLAALQALLAAAATQSALVGIFDDVARAPAINALIVDALVEMLRNLSNNRKLARQLSSITV
jgi:hypothetical protein